MKNIELVIPKIEEYFYEEKLEKDPNTMSYNKGYDVTYSGYDYNTGCIDFSKDKWKETYNKRAKENRYFAYIKDWNINKYVGYVNYQYNKDEDIYECGILIEYKYRGKGYSKDALRLLIKEANKNGIEYLYDTFEKDRKVALNLFLDLGFEVYKESSWKKFNKKVSGVILRIQTNKVLPDYSNLKTIEDVLSFMKDNIRYGWLDKNNDIHIGNMKNFRRLYRTLSIAEILNYGIGTCIDQVKLMSYLLNKINIKNKMFATRIYEPNDFNKLDEEEHMHCFVLCYTKNKVYHIEHPNFYKIGIYEYNTEKEALKKINKYYIDLSGGIARPITEFYKVKENISFKEFNNYINNLNITFRPLENNEDDYTKIYNWCQNKYVYEWFEQRKLTFEEIRNKYKNKLDKKKQKLYIIKSNDKDIGIVQIYKHGYDVNLEILKKYKNIYEYDLFIGEHDYLNEGLGKKIIGQINSLIYKTLYADCIILRPFKNNIRAIKCYESQGFKKIYEYSGHDTLGMIKDISIYIHKLERWHFDTDNKRLTKYVLEGKKTATTSLYAHDSLSNEDEFSVITDDNENSICLIKTEKVIVQKFKDIPWNLTKLEGENKSLAEWKKVHIKFFSKFNKNFNCNTKVIFEIFEVIKKY